MSGKHYLVAPPPPATHVRLHLSPCLDGTSLRPMRLAAEKAIHALSALESYEATVMPPAGGDSTSALLRCAANLALGCLFDEMANLAPYTQVYPKGFNTMAALELVRVIEDEREDAFPAAGDLAGLRKQLGQLRAIVGLLPTGPDEPPAEKARTALAGATARRSAKKRRVLRLKVLKGAILLDGEELQLDLTGEARDEALLFIRALLNSPGQWVSGPEIDKSVRWDRTRKGLPRALQALIESSPRKGYRLTKDAWRQ